MRTESSFGAFLDGWTHAEDTKKAKDLFHELWGQAHDNDKEYDKSKWRELNQLLEKLLK